MHMSRTAQKGTDTSVTFASQERGASCEFQFKSTKDSRLAMW